MPGLSLLFSELGRSPPSLFFPALGLGGLGQGLGFLVGSRGRWRREQGSGFWVLGNCENKPPSPTSFISFFHYLLLLSVTIFKN